MANDGGSILDQLANGGTPAAPKGLKQSQAGYQSSVLDDMAKGTGYDAVGSAQDWYTGANTQGTTSGWNTQFVSDFYDNYQRSVEEGTVRNYFDTGTGVVLYDHTSESDTVYKRGDVVIDGRIDHNLYDKFEDKAAADLLMLPFLADGVEQARLFKEGGADPQKQKELISGFVEAKSAEQRRLVTPEGLKFAEDTDETAESIRESVGGAGDELLGGGLGVSGGAATGAAIGALATSWGGPTAAVGAGVGGAIGAVVGGIGGLLNRDELTEKVARGYEMSELAFQKENFAAGVSTVAQQAGEVAISAMSPLTNLSRGAADAAFGEVGDGRVERLEDRKASTNNVFAVTDWIALAGDSALQFLNPVNRAIYTGATVAQIGGQVGQIGSTGGLFDPREGDFDNIFVDEEGNASPGSAIAGITMVGMDAVQLLGVRGLARQSEAQRSALDAGGEIRDMAGARFTLDAQGKVLDVQKTAALLAPSELIAYTTVAATARRAAAKQGRTVYTHDDFYRAAANLATGTSKTKAAIVNAWAEGVEEGAQAILEPVAMEGELDGRAALMAFAYGAAAGAGMSTAATINAPGASEQLFAQAYANATLANGEAPDKATFAQEWAGLNPVERQIRARMSRAQIEMQRAVLQKMADDATPTLMGSSLDAGKAIDDATKARATAAASAGTVTDQYRVITGLVDVGEVTRRGSMLNGTPPPEAVVTSARTVLALLKERYQGVRLQKEFAQRQIAEGSSPEVIDLWTERLAAAELMLGHGAKHLEQVESLVEIIYDERLSDTERRNALQTMNLLNEQAFRGKRELRRDVAATLTLAEIEESRDALAQFVGITHAREPRLDSGSFQVLLPWADLETTYRNGDNVLQINIDITQAVNGDFDGDKMHAENQLIMSREEFRRLRAGYNFAGFGKSIDIAAGAFDKGMAELLRGALDAAPSTGLHRAATARLGRIRTAIEGRYQGRIEPALLEEALSTFEAAVAAGDPKARNVLLDELARVGSEAILELGSALHSNEWLWISKIVRANFNGFQRSYRKMANTDAAGGQIVVATEATADDDVETPEGKNRRKTRATNTGATLSLWGNGDTLFRKFQQLHYNLLSSRAEMAGISQETVLTELAEVYRELSQRVTDSELKAIGFDTSVAGRVQYMLDRLVRSAMTDPDIAGTFDPRDAAVILGQLKVKDAWFEGDKLMSSNENISLIQLLMRRALDQERAEHATTWANDPELQLKHATLRSMTYADDKKRNPVNTARAFYEVFKGVQFSELIGPDTGELNALATPEQWMRDFTGLDKDQRTARAAHLKSDPAFLERKENTNPPYTWSELQNRKVSAYQSVVTAMLAVGQHELTFDPSRLSNGEMYGGRIGKQFRQIRDTFLAGHADLQAALQEFRELYKAQVGTRNNVELMQLMLEMNFKDGRKVLDQIPASLSSGIYSPEASGGVYVAPWVYEMLALSDPKKALVQYWKNLMLLQVEAAQSQGRSRDSISTRIGRLMHDLRLEPGHLHLRLLLQKLDAATDLEEFFEWLNTTPGYRTTGEPVFVPFFDDVVDFDPSALGSWASPRDSATIREAIQDAAAAAKAIRYTTDNLAKHRDTDVQIAHSALRWWNNDPDATTKDRINAERFEKAFRLAKDTPRAFSPNSMIAMLYGATENFDAGSSDKGKTTTTFAGFGTAQYRNETFTFHPGIERNLEVLTAHDSQGVLNNVGDILRTEGRMMDPDGQVIEWADIDERMVAEWLTRPSTANLAYAVMTPSALEVVATQPPALSEKTLFDSNLTELLEQKRLKQLYRGDPTFENNLLLISMIAAQARGMGGDFPIERHMMNRVVVMTSKFKREMTEYDREQVVTTVVNETAAMLRMIGKAKASAISRNANVLESLVDWMREEMTDGFKSRMLKWFRDPTTGKVRDDWRQEWLEILEATYRDRRQEAARSGNLTLAETLKSEYRFIKESLDRAAQSTSFKAHVEAYLLTGDPSRDATVRASLAAYALQNTNFPARVPQAEAEWQTLVQARESGVMPDETWTGWDVLSRSIAPLTMIDSLYAVAKNVAVAPLDEAPENETVMDSRFFHFSDPSYGWLVDDLFGRDATVMDAAAKMYIAADQDVSGSVSLEELQRLMRNSMLNPDNYGPWTDEIRTQLIEVNTRFDSSPGPTGIAGAGNGYKRQAIVASATRRTGRVPAASELSKASFSAALLGDDVDEFVEIPATLPDGRTVQMPVALLNNRFFGSITINGQPVRLDNSNLGFQWRGAERRNRYRYVALPRLRDHLERVAAAMNPPVDPSTLQVEVEFFHPDTQKPGDYHNAFFEGMSHHLAPDENVSLLATLWSDNDGLFAKETQWTIDSGKLGLKALMPFTRPNRQKVLELEEKWRTSGDLAGMLRDKAQYMATYDDGSPVLGIDQFNAIYKLLKTQHIVVGLDDSGAPVAWTADEVIAWQNANPGQPLPLNVEGLPDGGLVRLSPAAVRSLVGEAGGQALRSYSPDDLLMNPEEVEPFSTISPEMLARFAGVDAKGKPYGWLAGVRGLEESSLRFVSPGRLARTRPVMTTKERDRAETRRVELDARSVSVRAVRADKISREEARNSYIDVLKMAGLNIRQDNVDLDMSWAGFPSVMSKANDHSRAALSRLSRILDAKGYERGFVMKDGGDADLAAGRLTIEAIGAERDLKQHWLVRDDLVAVELETFIRANSEEQQLERLKKALDWITSSGATAVLVPGRGTSSLMLEAQRYLEGSNYDTIDGAQHLYGPVDFDARLSQNIRAAESTLIETYSIDTQLNSVTFLLKQPPPGLTENNALANPQSKKLRDRVLLRNVIPSAMRSHYGLPREDHQNTGLYAETLARLADVLDPSKPEKRAALVEMAGPDIDGYTPINEALTKLWQKVTQTRTLEPKVGDRIELGDAMVFLHPDGKVILYRHGLQLPIGSELDALFEQSGSGIIVGQTKIEKNATANSGVIVDERARIGFGRQIVLEQFLQELGDKVVQLDNGMKYTLVPWLKDLGFMRIFRNGLVVDMVSDKKSADSKGAYGGRINNLRNALAFFSFDFTDDLVRFFYPGLDKTQDPEGWANAVQGVEWFLQHVQKYHQNFPVRDVHTMKQVGDSLLALMETQEIDALTKMPSGWKGRLLSPSTDAGAHIAKAVLLYTMTPGADYRNVLKSGGFSHSRADSVGTRTRLVPPMFADLLDGPADGVVHTELLSRFNAQLDKAPNGEGFVLKPDWTAVYVDAKGRTYEGFLSFSQTISTGDNPVMNAEAFSFLASNGVSVHNAMAAGMAINGLVPYRELKDAVKYQAKVRDTTPVTPESLWKMLSEAPKESRNVSLHRETYAETLRRAAARDETLGFFRPINRSKFDSAQNAAVDQRIRDILRHMNLAGQRPALVEGWVRQYLGAPWAMKEDGTELGLIDYDQLMKALDDIYLNVQKNRLPIADGAVPLMDVNHLSTIHRANRFLEKPWVPSTTMAADGPGARSWEAMVDVAFGTAWLVKEGQFGLSAEYEGAFHPMFLLALDGFMHGYQHATSFTRELPISSDALVQRGLLDPETQRMIVSVSRDEDLAAADPVMLATTIEDIEQLVVGRRIYGNELGGPAKDSALGQQIAHRRRWERMSGAGTPSTGSIRSLRKQGRGFVNNVTKTTNFYRTLLNLRITNTLFSGALILAAPFDAFYRRSINIGSAMVTGESIGRGAETRVNAKLWLEEKRQAKVRELMESNPSAATALMTKSFSPAYDADQLQGLRTLSKNVLSSSSEFKAMINSETTFRNIVEDGAGRIGGFFERTAAAMATAQDFARGVRMSPLARIYVQTITREIVNGRSNIASIDTMIAKLGQDPRWVEKVDPETHAKAIAAIAQVRSTKQTALSVMFREVVEPMAQSDKFVVNTTGNFIKLFATFQTYWTNFGSTVTGMQGPMAFLAFMLDARAKGGLMTRFQNAVLGVEQSDEAPPEFYDMTEAIESSMLIDAFVQTAVTHTGLFALALMSGGLGLSGEDEEERWLRRMSEAQGVPLLRDPRSVTADFRNKDAIYLDWLPFGWEDRFKVDPDDPDARALANMHWVTRTLMSPILGIERFVNTGNFSELLHGFTDAIGSHPILNPVLVDRAMLTVSELEQKANDQIANDDMGGAASTMITLVSVLEGMLFENAMVNMIYVGMDEWDRDPYKLPLTDSDGDLQKDIQGTSRANDLAMAPFVNENGEVQVGYEQRTERASQLRVLTENRFTMAMVLSFMNGGIGTSDFNRYNMVTKDRSIDRQSISDEDLEILVRAAAAFQAREAGMVEATAQELRPMIMGQAIAYGKATDQFIGQDQVWAMAEQRSKELGLVADNMIDRENDLAALGDRRLKALYNGLLHGTITLDDPAVKSMWASYEQRNRVAEEIATELMQEGLNLGLDGSAAGYRMRRIMDGQFGSAEVGIRELLYDKRIPYQESALYRQQNSSYVIGPDGRPWASGFERDGLLGALGLDMFNAPLAPVDGKTGRDARGNTTDLVAGFNTGLRGLVPLDESRLIPTDVEIGKSIEKAIEKALKKQYTVDPETKPDGNGYRGGWRSFGRRYGGGGGGGGAYFTRMYGLPENISVYGNSLPFINTSNPIIRRSTIRRERVWSERGRLNQWQ